MSRDSLFVDPATTELDVEQIYAEALPLAKLIGLFVAIALVPLLFALAFGSFAGIGGLFVLLAQFVLAVGTGIVLMYVIVRAQTLAGPTTNTRSTSATDSTASSTAPTASTESVTPSDASDASNASDEPSTVEAQRRVGEHGENPDVDASEDDDADADDADADDADADDAGASEDANASGR